MKRCININTHIVVSTQLSTDHLPKKFSYTCFCWLPNIGIFNEYSKLAACGTQEGSILIIGKKNDIAKNDIQNDSNSEFVFVSFLSGHEAAITDICVLNKLNLFLSISKDAKICGWSLQDCSCEFQIQLNLNYGSYFFSIYPVKIKYIWITRYGESIFLIDISTGEIIKQFPYPGIKSFEVICPHPNLKNSPVYGICVGSIQTSIYLIENKCNFIEQKTILNDEKYKFNIIMKVCQFGIIKIDKNQLEIINPKANPKVLYNGTFSELPGDDSIISVNFNISRTLFVACSLLGRFFIVNLKNGMKSVSIEYIYHFSEPLFINQNIAFNNQKDILFSAGSKSIFYLNDQKQIEKVEYKKGLEKVKNSELDVYHLNGTENPIFFRSHDNILSLISISSQKFDRTIEFHRRITAIFERKLNGIGQTEIIIGFDNGTVCFYSNYHPKYLTILTGEIQCFIPLSSKSDIIAIDLNGSACLIRPDLSYLSFETPLVRIKNVHFISHLNLLTFGFEDGSYLIYSVDSPTPIEISMKPPKEAKLIWPKPVEFGYSSEFSSLLSRKNIVYEIFDIPNLYHVVRSNFFQFQRGLVTDGYMKNKVKYLISICNFLFELFESRVKNESGSNLALIGANDQPTFFYDSFHFTGEMICDLSPFVGSSQFISYYMLSEALNDDGKLLTDTSFFSKVHFLPSLLQFIYFPDEVVKRTVCRLCILLSNYVSFQTCQEYLAPFAILNNLNEVEEYDKFLMSILVVRYPNTLPSFFISELYDFLDELTVNNSEQTVLAISILIDGISLWGSKTEKKEGIYITIIESMLRQTRSIFLCNKFYNVACSDMDSLMKSFPVLISTSIFDLEKVENIFNLFTSIAFKNQKACGGTISDMFASQCSKFPQLIELVSSQIESHSKIFQFVKVVDNFFLIGLADSFVHAYNEGKLIFSEKIFNENTDVAFVSIGPLKKFGVAVSEKLKKAKIFCLSKPNKRLFRAAKSRVLREFDVVGITNVNFFSANWINVDDCEITVRHSKK